MQNNFTVLKIPCTPLVHSSFPTPKALATADFLPLPECHVVGIIEHVAFSDQLLSLSNMHLSFLMSFHDLLVYFFLVLNNIPLYECSIVYLAIQLLKVFSQKCTTPRVNPKINYWFLGDYNILVLVHPWQNKCTVLVNDVDIGVDNACVGSGSR